MEKWTPPLKQACILYRIAYVSEVYGMEKWPPPLKQIYYTEVKIL